MRRQLLIGLALTVAVLAVFWQVHAHDFVNFDDQQYVTDNPHVRAGLTFKGIAWAFTTFHASNWHPLTWLSHMLDCQLFGLNPSGHHLTSVLLHLANTLLLSFVLYRMTGAIWRSFLVAALFALHPLHVESVAWVAERKDVLSTLFWLLTMWAYVRYVEQPAVHRYLVILLAFALGLMAKPMLVTLPFVLLLLDYWPLGRVHHQESPTPQTDTGRGCGRQEIPLLHAVREKIPLFVLSAGSCVVTFVAQQSGGAIGSLDVIPAKTRVANALVSYISYIGKMVWPHPLAVFYPHPGDTLLTWQVAGASVLLLCSTWLAIAARRRYPYVLMGWLWYLETLVPVIGLVQVGSQAMADRYTYVPLLGLCIIMAWGLGDLGSSWRYPRTVLGMGALVLLLALSLCTWRQLRHWRSSITLFEHDLQVTRSNFVAHNNLGNALKQEGKIDQAIFHLSMAVQMKPDSAGAHTNLGDALARQGRLDEAMGHLSEALRLEPDFAGAHLNLGNALELQGRLHEAISHFARALQLSPDFAEAHYNLGTALARQGKMEEAMSHLSRAIQLSPRFAEAWHNLGAVLALQGRFEEAVGYFSEALRLKPDYAEARTNLELSVRRLTREKKSESPR